MPRPLSPGKSRTRADSREAPPGTGGLLGRARRGAGAGTRPSARQVPPFNHFLALTGASTSRTPRGRGERGRAALLPRAVPDCAGKLPLHRDQPLKTTCPEVVSLLSSRVAPKSRDFPQLKFPGIGFSFPGAKTPGQDLAGAPSERAGAQTGSELLYRTPLPIHMKGSGLVQKGRTAATSCW